MRRFGPEFSLEDAVLDRAIDEGPGPDSCRPGEKPRDRAKAHINSLTNWELVKLISRALED